jgi:hypothetical protein
MCTVYSALCTVYSAMCTVYSALCIVHCALCTAFSALCTVKSIYTLGTVYCVLAYWHLYIGEGVVSAEKQPPPLPFFSM